MRATFSLKAFYLGLLFAVLVSGQATVFLFLGLPFALAYRSFLFLALTLLADLLFWENITNWMGVPFSFLITFTLIMFISDYIKRKFIW